MNEPKVSVVVAFRDREVGRVENLFLSLTRHNQTEVEFLVCDYGSREPIRADLARLAAQTGFAVVRSETQGLPWNKAVALNTGVRRARAPWVLVVDVDMVFHDSVLDDLVPVITENQIWLLESLWPQNKHQRPLKGKPLRSPGVFQLMSRQWFETLNGYCEDFEYWGQEDSDWVQRVAMAGGEVKWLGSDRFRLTHIWHPRENNPVTRPTTAVTEALSTEVRNGWQPYVNPTWGHQVTRDDRPILQAMETRPFEEVDLTGISVQALALRIRELLEARCLVRVNLGPRVQSRLLTRFAGAFFYFHELLKPFSLRIEYKTEANLEVLLALRKQIGKASVDVFLAPELEYGYLLLK